jgi:ribonuclease-3
MTNALIQKLNYEFANPDLLKMALTHRSRGSDHNERLEFLGDAVVNFVIAEILYHQFPRATEGELSRWRSTLVNRDTLAELAKEFELGRYLLLGPGELRSGGNERQSILSCAMEAIIGAVYLDGGFDAARHAISIWYEPLLQTLSSAGSHKDPKTLLQEYLQSRRLPLPVYMVERIEGEAHQQIFTVSCQVEGVTEKAFGKGTSRRRAEQDAAQAMLGAINR